MFQVQMIQMIWICQSSPFLSALITNAPLGKLLKSLLNHMNPGPVTGQLDKKQMFASLCKSEQSQKSEGQLQVRLDVFREPQGY